MPNRDAAEAAEEMINESEEIPTDDLLSDTEVYDEDDKEAEPDLSPEELDEDPEELDFEPDAATDDPEQD